MIDDTVLENEAKDSWNQKIYNVTNYFLQTNLHYNREMIDDTVLKNEAKDSWNQEIYNVTNCLLEKKRKYRSSNPRAILHKNQMEQYHMSTVKARRHATSREAGNNYSLAPRAQESLPPHTLPCLKLKTIH